MDQQNTYARKFWTHELPTRKSLGPTKHPGEKILDPRNIHEKKFWTHEGTKTRRYDETMAQDPHNLAHSYNFNSNRFITAVN